MGSFRVFNQRNGRLATLAALSVATVTQAFIPALVSADQITDRSVALSSASAQATDVSYTVSFTAVQAAGAYVVEFCTNTPLIGQDCTAPTGMVATNAAKGTDGNTTATAVTGAANKLTVTNAITASQAVKDTFTGITNPQDAGTVYARIVTYDNPTNAGNYSSTLTSTTGVKDQGSVALSITDSMGVSGDVLETMQFCVSGDNAQTPGSTPFSAGCVDTGGNSVTKPALNLGEKNGSVTALDSGHVSTGLVFTQMSTNAQGGAVVYLKSSTTGCGGLTLAGTGACNIKPLTTGAADFAGTAAFGVKLGADVDSGTGSARQAFIHDGSYGSTNYFMNYVAGDATGVTSTYGDPILTTDGTQVNSQDMQLTFGASIAPNTPAGRYSADLSLIATGTF